MVGQKVEITETEEVPLGDGVKLVRDVTEAPKREEVEIKKTVTIEKKTVGDD